MGPGESTAELAFTFQAVYLGATLASQRIPYVPEAGVSPEHREVWPLADYTLLVLSKGALSDNVMFAGPHPERLGGGERRVLPAKARPGHVGPITQCSQPSGAHRPPGPMGASRDGRFWGEEGGAGDQTWGLTPARDGHYPFLPRPSPHKATSEFKDEVKAQIAVAGAPAMTPPVTQFP